MDNIPAGCFRQRNPPTTSCSFDPKPCYPTTPMSSHSPPPPFLISTFRMQSKGRNGPPVIPQQHRRFVIFYFGHRVCIVCLLYPLSFCMYSRSCYFNDVVLNHQPLEFNLCFIHQVTFLKRSNSKEIAYGERAGVEVEGTRFTGATVVKGVASLSLVCFVRRESL
jgi:hypothetical protein